VTDELVPPGVDQRDAALLRRAYALTTQADGEQLYAEWATSYDTTMVDGLGYEIHRTAADRFAAEVPWRDRRVLDIGCGTGLVGVALAAHGFTHVDGIDLSPAMLAVARATNVYGELAVADLTQPLDIADATFDSAICTGTFTSGHVDATCLDEIVRVLKPGAVFVTSVHRVVWRDKGFAEAFDRLAADGKIAIIEIVGVHFYENSPSSDGNLCVIRRR
jgi:predicted TPR repeat methyltransferase